MEWWEGGGERPPGAKASSLELPFNKHTSGGMPDHTIESSEPGDGSRVRYLDIEVSSAGIAELARDGRPVVSVPREELRTVELRYGPPGERLFVQTVVGAAVLVVGLALGRGIVTWLFYGGYANLNAGAGSVTFTLGGAWLLWRAWRPRHHLRLVTSKGTRRLSFGNVADEASIALVLRAITQTLGIVVKDSRQPAKGPYRDR